MQKTNEQPGAEATTISGLATEPVQNTSGNQFDTFKSRIVPNIGVPYWPSEVMQYFIERPHVIPLVLERSLNSTIVRNPESALQTIEHVIWGCGGYNPSDAKKLLIWVFRQSKGLTENVVLHSPYDPDEDGYNSPIAGATVELVERTSVSASTVPLWLILRGLGSPLYLSCGASENVWHLYLTYRSHDSRGARRLSWKDAMAGIQEIQIPKLSSLVVP